MTQLYSTFANVYHVMYQHIFDYDKEFEFYDAILRKNNCHKILEIGCGTGLLAQRFVANGYDYLGMDLHEEMLDIARSEAPSASFIQSDMSNFLFKKQFDAILITGRSLAYITSKLQVVNTFFSVNNSLVKKGIFVFGVFEAPAIFEDMHDFEQNIEHGNRKIKRINKLKKNISPAETWDWHAKYIIDDGGTITEFEEQATLRAFTKKDIEETLQIIGFAVKEIIDEGKTFTVVAEKG